MARKTPPAATLPPGSTNLFLDDAELEQLTGYKLAHYQIIWLRKRSWRFETNAAGRPRVARAHFERKMGCEVTAAEPLPAGKHNFGALRERPNFDALRAPTKMRGGKK